MVSVDEGIRRRIGPFYGTGQTFETFAAAFHDAGGPDECPVVGAEQVTIRYFFALWGRIIFFSHFRLVILFLLG